MDLSSSSPTSDSMDTAIEEPLRPKTWFERARAGVDSVIMAFCSENALTIYIFFHWLLACASHIIFANKDSSEDAGFISFIYFMVTLMSFLSIMSHVSGLLIPLFLFSTTAPVLIFIMTNLALIRAPGAHELYVSVCNTDLTKIYCKTLESNPRITFIESYLLIFFFLATSAAIVFQFERNDAYNRNPPPPYPQHFLYYPHMVPREVPVGATNLDEPPRYSSLEPPPPKPPTTGNTTTSTITSPPRYSYWERTFGRQRSPSQWSTTTAKEHENC